MRTVPCFVAALAMTAFAVSPEIELSSEPRVAGEAESRVQDAPAPGRGSLLVLHKTDSTLGFVDPERSALVSVIGTGIGPHEIAVEPGGVRAVVSNYGA